MRARCSFACLLCLILSSAFSAFAHPPRESVTGTFLRADGTTISIVRHYVDGIVAADPVSIQFRLPDGTEVAHTSHVFDAIVRPNASGVEVYQFRSNWLPVANRVESFDGYNLKDITSSHRLLSLHIHFTGHWVGYLVVTGFAAFFGALYFSLRAIPERGWRGRVRSIGLAFVYVAGSLFVYIILMFEPVSPLVLVGSGAILFAFFRIIRRKWQTIKHGEQRLPRP